LVKRSAVVVFFYLFYQAEGAAMRAEWLNSVESLPTPNQTPSTSPHFAMAASGGGGEARRAEDEAEGGEEGAVEIPSVRLDEFVATMLRGTFEWIGDHHVLVIEPGIAFDEESEPPPRTLLRIDSELAIALQGVIKSAIVCHLADDGTLVDVRTETGEPAVVVLKIISTCTAWRGRRGARRGGGAVRAIAGLSRRFRPLCGFRGSLACSQAGRPREECVGVGLGGEVGLGRRGARRADCARRPRGRARIPTQRWR
jgi:hypothetical protein